MTEPLPHIVPGQPRRSMYGEHNTHDEQVALTAAAFQRLADGIRGPRAGWYWARDDDGTPAEREPIRVVAEVGRRIES